LYAIKSGTAIVNFLIKIIQTISMKQITKLFLIFILPINDLANIKENQGKLSEALQLYKQAIKIDRELAYSYAGIGDQHDYRKTAKFYQKFLTLQSEKGRIDHVKKYKQSLKKAQANIFVSADEIFQKLSVKRNLFIPKIGIPIQFGTSSSKIENDDKVLKQCQEIAKAVHDFFRTDENSKIRIEGHTDNEGNTQGNKALSEKRARSIKDWLVKRNIPEKRLLVIGWGEEKPRETNETGHGKFLNRRVTLVRIE